MAYRSTNAAYAYDMQPQSYSGGLGSTAPSLAPQEVSRPRFDVLTGAGREADQQASPVFLSVIKVLCALVIVFAAVGVARVSLTSATAATLNANAEMNSKLEQGRETSSNLEVMRSVYGSDSRIRDIAGATLGMVDADHSVTLDFAGDVKASSNDADAPASDASSAGNADSQ